jgi:beta-glucosidase
MNRRTLMLAGAATLLGSHAARADDVKRQHARVFPKGFLWGAATAGHQVEGNNTTSDLWLLEHIKPTIFAEPSGDACNSLELWDHDLDLVRALGLNTYRFSLEWARIEPEPGQFSIAMLDHYARIIDGCRARGLTPMVTFNHFTAPRWFSAGGGWLSPDSASRFAKYCERAARHLGAHIGYATTLNEPNILQLLKMIGLPPPLLEAQRAMLTAAAKASGTAKFAALNAANEEDMERMLPNLLAGHRRGREAIKSAHPTLPVGVSLAMIDDQAVAGGEARRDARREFCYGAWLEAARQDDFIGVQNYERARIGPDGPLPPPDGAPGNWSGAEVFPASLGNAVRYAHAATGRPVIVTEHGIGTDDDAQRARLIPEALEGLHAAMNEGIPVQGYVHWSLLDNFEWIFGYRPHFGLVAVDRQTFKRTSKPSAAVYGAIARHNALG